MHLDTRRLKRAVPWQAGSVMVLINIFAVAVFAYAGPLWAVSLTPAATLILCTEAYYTERNA